MTDIEKEREAFEAWIDQREMYLDRRANGDYASIATNGAWEGWLARARSERVVSVGELEALCDEWENHKAKLSAQSYDLGEQDGLRSAAYDLRALIAKAGVE